VGGTCGTHRGVEMCLKCFGREARREQTSEKT
jgi:hypothetical protein